MWRRALSTPTAPTFGFCCKLGAPLGLISRASLPRAARRAGAAAGWRPDQASGRRPPPRSPNNFNRKQNDPKDPTDSSAGFRV